MRSFKKPLKAEEERYYLKMYRDGDEKAKEKLIEHNLRLVAHIVKKYQPPPEELLMMIRQEKKILREVSLYEPIGTDQEGNHISLLDIISTEEAELIEQYLHKYYLSRLEQEVFLLTDDREREIILKRYGLCGNEPHTQKEVAAMMGISRSYVSRIEKKALEKLRSSYEQYM